jgi:hypothetical protein
VTNPWTKKNPLMSMWLSGANKVADQARGHARSEANKQAAALTQQAVRFWTGAWSAAAKPKRRC